MEIIISIVVVIGIAAFLYCRDENSESIISEQDGGQIIDVRNVKKVVLEWNTLHNAYQKSTATYDPMRSVEECQLSDKIRDLEDACVAIYSVSPKVRSFIGKNTLEDAVQPFIKKDLTNELKSYDDIALAILQTKISSTIADDDNRIWNLIEEKCGDYINSLSEEDADCVKFLISQQSIPLMAAFYEIAITDALGKPYNVYVAQNIRVVFTIAVRRSFDQNHGVELDEDNAKILIRNYCHGLRGIVNDLYKGNPEAFAKYFLSMQLNHCRDAITEKLSYDLGQAFLQYIKEKSPLIKLIILEAK